MCALTNERILECWHIDTLHSGSVHVQLFCGWFRGHAGTKKKLPVIDLLPHQIFSPPNDHTFAL